MNKPLKISKKQRKPDLNHKIEIKKPFIIIK